MEVWGGLKKWFKSVCAFVRKTNVWLPFAHFFLSSLSVLHKNSTEKEVREAGVQHQEGWRARHDVSRRNDVGGVRVVACV